MRKPIIAGNWKMNETPSQAVALINEIKPLVADAKCEVVVCPPFVCLPAAKDALKGSNIKLGAQNVHWEEKGAYTGEISAPMLKEIGVEYVIIGHSERRQYFAETDQTVNNKVLAAFTHDLTPIVCVGETLEQREAGQTEKLVRNQIKEALEGLVTDAVRQVVIAYEPIWAIGTGRNASPEDANDVIKIIRDTVAGMFGQDVAEAVRIQYGGSVNAKNAADLLAMSDIDGALVGGASLKAADFATIVKAC
jgi:triosephosphate isomerase